MLVRHSIGFDGAVMVSSRIDPRPPRHSERQREACGQDAGRLGAMPARAKTFKLGVELLPIAFAERAAREGQRGKAHHAGGHMRAGICGSAVGRGRVVAMSCLPADGANDEPAAVCARARARPCRIRA